MQNREIEIHPAANIFPMMSDAEYQSLKADIEKNGVNVWMTFYDGKLLDGRNRYRACVELGINADHYSEQIDVDLIPDPVAWVLSLNLHRRHLTDTQRATVAAKIANLKHGGDRKSEIKGQICPLIISTVTRFSKQAIHRHLGQTAARGNSNVNTE